MKVIFIDGECLFCHTLVKFISKYDNAKFKFSSLQGDFAKQNLPEKLRLDLDSVVYYEDGQIYTKSFALRRVTRQLKYPVKFFNFLFNLIPTFLLDMGYDFIATRRMFISSNFCSLNSIDKSKFIS